MSTNLSDPQTLMMLSTFGTASTAVTSLIEHMDHLSRRDRVKVFQALGDFFCPRCGIEQPQGDCQCRTVRHEADLAERVVELERVVRQLVLNQTG